MCHSGVLVHQLFIFVKIVFSGRFSKDAGLFLTQNCQEKSMTLSNETELLLKVCRTGVISFNIIIYSLTIWNSALF